MPTYTAGVIAAITGFGVFLWLALYLLVRTPRRSALAVVSVLGLCAQALFFLAAALTDTTSDQRLLATLERATWWTAVAPIAVWFHFSALIAGRLAGGRPPGAFTPAVAIVYAAALLLAGVGTASDLLVHYATVEPGPGYVAYTAYLGVIGTGAAANFVRAARAARAAQPVTRELLLPLRLLESGALLFLAGALWLAVRWGAGLPLPQLPGTTALLLGGAALGYGIVTSGTILEGQHVRRDFLYSLTGLALLNLLYVAALALAGASSTPVLLMIVALVTFTHMTLDQARALLDRAFFSVPVREARAEARDYAAILSTTPVAPVVGGDLGGATDDGRRTTDEDTPVADGSPADSADTVAAAEAPSSLVVRPSPEHTQPPVDVTSATEKEFRAQVRRALTSLKSPPRLAQSELLTLRVVGRRLAEAGLEDNRLNRAALLREVLIERIDGLRPGAGDQGSHHVGEAWRFYNVLYYPYVRELSRKSALAEARRLELARRREGRREPGELEQVLAWLADVDEDTFYKWQRRASDTIALILWEEERAGR